jgi:hypothetical protein
VHRDTCGSDHYPNICRFTEPNPKETKGLGWRTKTANWEGYHKTLTEILQETGEKLTIEEITSAIHESATKNVKITSQEVPQRRLKWMTTEIREETKKRRKAERKHKSTPNTENLLEFKKLMTTVRRMMRKDKKEACEEFVGSINERTSSQEM